MKSLLHLGVDNNENSHFLNEFETYSYLMHAYEEYYTKSQKGVDEEVVED